MTAATETRPPAEADGAAVDENAARVAQLAAQIDAIAARRMRPPTKKVPHPLIVVEGLHGSGKSWCIAEFSASSKVGRVYWLELGAEGTHDQYGAVPGAKFEIVDHTGDWHDILAAVRDVKEIARLALAAGEPPVVLAFETATAEWEMLSNWADARSRNSDTARLKLQKDPDADITTSHTHWTAAKRRHRKLMTELLTFPGIVVVTAQSEWGAEFKNNRPVEGAPPIYKVKAEGSLLRDAMVVVRLSNEPRTPPLVTKCRSVQHAVRPGYDDPKPYEDFSLEDLVFRVLGYEPQDSHVRDIKELTAGDLTEDERPEEEVAEERRVEQHRARRQGAVETGGRRQFAAPPVEQAARPAVPSPQEEMKILLARVAAGYVKLNITVAGDQLALATALIGRPIGSSADLTKDDLEKLLNELINLFAMDDRGAALIPRLIAEARGEKADVPA
ncbi:hypothetical protein [Saccharothrix hoggarensis]|uniref:AAA domain-containing protein n=1 Tax=Saccharothrix hoggarensis TaxID=913853 RepID=A0ABW3QMD1_9PSEU